MQVHTSGSKLCGLWNKRRALADWVSREPARLFGLAGAAGDLAILVAGGLSGNPLTAYCGVSGLSLQGLNIAFGERVTPLTNGMIVLQGIAMAAAGLGVGGAPSAGQVLSGVTVGGAGFLMGLEGWSSLLHKVVRPKHPPSRAPFEVAASSSRVVGLSGNAAELGRRLEDLSDRLSRHGVTRKNMVSTLFAASNVGLAKAAISGHDPMIMAAAVCFSLSTLAARLDAPRGDAASARPANEPRSTSQRSPS